MFWTVQFGPLEETYAVLARFEVSATEEEQTMLAGLEQAGEDFKTMLREVEQVRAKLTLSNKSWDQNTPAVLLNKSTTSYAQVT